MKNLLPKVINLPWIKDAAEKWFASISDTSWAMLLHSGYSNHIYGRFDIIVADPIGTITTQDDITQVTLNNTFTSTEDPLVLLKELINSHNLCTISHPDLPFQGGALGLFGYDLGRRFEKLPKKSLRDIDLPDMAVGIYDWALIIDHYKKQVTLLSYSNVENRLAWLKAQKKLTNVDFHLITSWRANMNTEDYKIKFTKVKHFLYTGDCYQVNLAQRFQAYYEGDEWQAFTHLNIQNRSPFSAFLRLEKGTILSFSPEQFIQLSNSNIRTRPIKGTLPRIYPLEKDSKQTYRLLNSIKDRAENLMIVDLMRNDIGKVAIPGTVKVPEIFTVESFPAVHHLVSTITANLLPSYSACDLLRAVFPGGSITGAPKIRAMEIIDELEPHRRNAWCGSIGYLSYCGCMNTNINIRTLILSKSQIYCYAGGGIVADSDPNDEYQETFNKVNLILKQLEKINLKYK